MNKRKLLISQNSVAENIDKSSKLQNELYF